MNENSKPKNKYQNMKSKVDSYRSKSNMSKIIDKIK